MTLALGYRYLWIDSLCIIQHDEIDWAHEARLMATVYGNADCNLAFLFASFTRIPRSDSRDWNPCILRPATPELLGISIHHRTSLSASSVEAKDWLKQSNWPLFSRAWTFQEYLLAPRTLLLGHANLMFQCTRYFYDELLGPISPAPRVARDGTINRPMSLAKTQYFPDSLQQNWEKELRMSSFSSLQFTMDWQGVLNEYRGRKLTQAKDRVVAFSGIARAYANVGALTYVAGCWAEYFSLTLLWYVGKKRVMGSLKEVEYWEEVRPGVREDVVCDAPSWSQFSVPVYTEYQTGFVFDEDEINARMMFEEGGVDPAVWWDDVHWSYLEVFKYAGVPEDDFPDSGYADLGGLEVTIVMPILPAQVSWVEDVEEQLGIIRASDPRDAGISWRTVFAYFPDDPLLAVKPPEDSLLVLVSEFQLCRVPGINNVDRRLAGLVLVRGQRKGTWKRVGAWKSRAKITGMDIHDGNLRDVARRWRKHTLWDTSDRGKWSLKRLTLV